MDLQVKKMTKELAKKEVERWLDHKRVKFSKRVNFSQIIDSLEEHFCDGVLRLDNDFNIIQTLDFPIENSKGEVTVPELKFKPFLKVGEIFDKSAMIDNPKNNPEIKLLVHIAALTNQPVLVLKNLSIEDNSVAQLIASFFV